MNIIVIVIFFLIGLLYYSTRDYGYGLTEGFTGLNNRCPNMLIQDGSRIYLYNSKLAKVPGVNPISFENLEDYTEFLEWQKSQGIRCPVLYLQSGYDAQGNMSYTVRPSISNPQSGLPPSTATPIGIASSSDTKIVETSFSGENMNMNMNMNTNNNDNLNVNPKEKTLLVDAGRNDPPFNENSYPGYDPSNYYQGKYTPLDAVDTAKKSLKMSPDPMDDNWGGAKYTQQLIDAGYYKGDEVSLYVP